MTANIPTDSSALKFNYLLRPRKSIERKMLAESFRHLRAFAPLKDYEYIGFGTFYFADFKLFHRQLGINHMISIEGDSSIMRRVQFNRPFAKRVIRIEEGRSTQFLMKHDWKRRAIIWLDYDRILNTEQLRDVELVIQNAPSGTILLITTDCDSKAFEKKIPAAVKHNIEKLFDLIDPHIIKLPQSDKIRELFKLCGQGDLKLETLIENLDGQLIDGITETDLGSNLPKILQDIILSEISRGIRARAAKNSMQAVEFKQLYSFIYADGRSMYTMGGIILDSVDKAKFVESGIGQLDFNRTANSFLTINAPHLTVKERAHLEGLIPTDNAKEGKTIGIEHDEFAAFCDAYRYYPSFTEMDV